MWTREEINKLTQEEQLDLYKKANDAYNTGSLLMNDIDFDWLEKKLNLRNNYKPGASKSDVFTIPHSFMMGSLVKVHTDIDLKTGVVDFDKVATEVNRSIQKSECGFIEFSPKLDGCSFSIEIDETGNFTVAQRGDGAFGQDIKKQFEHNRNVNNTFCNLEKAAHELLVNSSWDKLVIRGEVLVDKKLYAEKYAEKYANSRVFVSGNLNADWTETDEYKEMIADMSFVTYDFRLYNKENNMYNELDWMCKDDFMHDLISGYLDNNGLGELPDPNYCMVFEFNNEITTDKIKEIYWKYHNYRNSDECRYALDGIVVKPNAGARLMEPDRERPRDCIAIKFIVEILESVIEDIEWTVGKTGECYPKAIIKPVYQDGKEIRRASLHGYSSLLENKAGIGSKVKITLSGDIIPDIYEVETPGTLKLPDFPTEVKYLKEDKNVPHLMKVFTAEEMTKHKFICSVKASGISGIAEKTAEKLWDAVAETYEEVTGDELINIMYLMGKYYYKLIIDMMGDSKSIQNIVSSLKTYHEKANLADLIRCFCFDGCGEVSSMLCARILSGLSYETAGINEASYAWALKKSSYEKYIVLKYAEELGIEFLKEEPKEVTGERIGVIMTGEPSDCTRYETKSKWLAAHPQYFDAKSSWTNCKILFTNDLNSKTGKMKKAADKGIEIRLYED